MTRSSIVGLALVAVLGACSNEARPPAVTAADLQASKTAAHSDPHRTDSHRSSLQVDPEIARACDLPTSHFDFDSAALQTGDEPALDSLASCLVDGALAGKSIKLVGHADPRGEEHYNFALGARRAGSVEDYLVTRGVGRDRIETSSMGELEATGTDEESWARDRKVEVLLAR